MFSLANLAKENVGLALTQQGDRSVFVVNILATPVGT